jgi:hypothetical protein
MKGRDETAWLGGQMGYDELKEEKKPPDVIWKGLVGMERVRYERG